MKYYFRLWQESPGAMTLLHVLVIGFVVSLALLGRDPLKSLLALVGTGLAAWLLLPVCVAWNIKRMRGG